MSRPYRARLTFALALALAVILAGCQDYNFNPVGHCLIQTGSKRVPLSNVSSADVLFVVDDSGSMAGEQQNLASNFNAFITKLDDANKDRQAAGLAAFDFHIAVTSTSVFWNFQTDAKPLGPYTCTSSCAGAEGRSVCCNRNGGLARQPRACTSNADCAGVPGAGVTCNTECSRLRGANYCCVPGTVAPSVDEIPCGREGTECGSLERHYDFSGCGASTSDGVAWNGYPYPQGDFVSWSNASGTVNPRVLHFDKELYETGTNLQGFTRAQLVSFFSGSPAGTNGNVVVGTCGSGQEQPLQAARLAIEKARRGEQKDTYARTWTGGGTPPAMWNPTTRVAGSTADWFAADKASTSKLVVVFVGDEDDCSSPADPSAGVVIDVADFVGAGTDSCSLDQGRAAPLGQKLFRVQPSADSPGESFVEFFTGLGRPVAAGFILPAAERSCTLQTCSTGSLCCPTASCGSNEGAQGRGLRLLDTARSLASRGVEVVAGSICDGTFSTILDDIAELVKPPSGLELPTQPAATEVTLLRILKPDGTSRVCGRPLAARTGANYTLAEAQATGADWWFTATADPGPPAADPSTTKFVYINERGDCVADAGETYSADYIGRVPEGGCYNTLQVDADEMCRRTLGGAAGSWTCYGGEGASTNVCGNPTERAPGTCICGSRAQNCPNG